MFLIPHPYRAVTMRNGDICCADCFAFESDSIHVRDLLEELKPLMKAGRKINFRFVAERYIVTAIPLSFEGGPIPDGWRSEHVQLDEAIKTLLTTWTDPPTDFQWER